MFRKPFSPAVLVCLLSGFILSTACNRDAVKAAVVHRGNVVAVTNADFDYVEGDLIDCKNVSVAFLKGDIRGRKSRGIHVGVMHGNVLGGQARIDILDGNVVDGESISVRVLIGEDLSGRADVLDRTAAPRTTF